VFQDLRGTTPPHPVNIEGQGANKPTKRELSNGSGLHENIDWSSESLIISSWSLTNAFDPPSPYNNGILTLKIPMRQ
jgi:hypothetical protein